MMIDVTDTRDIPDTRYNDMMIGVNDTRVCLMLDIMT